MSEKSEKFVEQASGLVDVFQSAVASSDWVTQTYPKQMRDEDDNPYTVPTLTLQKGPKRLYLEPTGYDIPGADGVADLYAMPGGEPVASLYLESNAWVIHSPFPSRAMAAARPSEWGRADVSVESIRTVLEAIDVDAVQSA